MAVTYVVKSLAAGRYISLTKQPVDIYTVVIDCTPFAQDSRGNTITISSITSSIINAGSGGTAPLDLSGGNTPTIVAIGGVSGMGVQFTLSGGDTTWNSTATPPTPGIGTGNILLTWSNGEKKQLDLLISIRDT